MSKQTKVLLLSRLKNFAVELRNVLRHALSALVRFQETCVRSLVVFLHDFKESFISVKQQLILTQVDILGRDRMLAQMSSHQNAN